MIQLSFTVAAAENPPDAANLQPVSNLIELQNAVTLLNEYTKLIKQLQTKTEFLEAIKRHQRNELVLMKLENQNLKRTISGLRNLAEINIQEIINQTEEAPRLKNYQKLVKELSSSLKIHDQLFNTTEELIRTTQLSYKEMLEMINKKEQENN